jgi:DNA polymerase-3 subunit delta'
LNFWQTEQFKRLWQAKVNNCLPHALLFKGIKGTNKAAGAEYLSRALLCHQVTAQGECCGECHHCRLIMGRVHPNVLWIEPEKAGAAIKVDQIRAVNDFINQTSLQGEYRVVIIHTADEMNMNAANALLKTLEEPSSGAILILISDQKARLPATILSRCQRVIFPPPSKEQTFIWLANQPSRQNLFQALGLMLTSKGDPLKAAAELQNNDLVSLLDFFLSWIMDVLRLQLDGNVEGLINQDHVSQLIESKQKTHIKSNVKLMDYIQVLRGKMTEGINFNKQLLLESLFIRWMGCVYVSC